MQDVLNCDPASALALLLAPNQTNSTSATSLSVYYTNAARPTCSATCCGSTRRPASLAETFGYIECRRIARGNAILGRATQRLAATASPTRRQPVTSVPCTVFCTSSLQRPLALAARPVVGPMCGRGR